MQELLKKVIVAVADAGMASNFFFMFHILGLFAGIGIAMWYGHKMGYKPYKGIYLVLIGFSLTYTWMLIFYWIQSGFKNFGGQNHVMTFIYQPLIYGIPAKFLKIERDKYCSVLAVGVPMVQGIGHIGCVFGGCCAGYPCDWGVYNINSGMYHFPNQLIEATVAIAIAIYIMHRIKQANYVPNPRSFPMMLILYGVTRFFLEFLRDNEKILLGCSALAFHALFMALVGVVWLVVLRNKEKYAEKN